MPLNFTAQDRAALARRFRERGIPGGQEFIQDWVSFNACYNAAGGKSERDRVTNIIREYIAPGEATQLLQNLASAVEYFSRLPPGDDRRAAHNPNFRRQSTEDLQVVNDVSATPVERLARLMSVVYQVRCNLMHGDKDPDSKRDRELVKYSRVVLQQVLSSVLSAME
jgi:hypothetical protein